MLKLPKVIVHIDIETLGQTHTAVVTQLGMIGHTAEDPDIIIAQDTHSNLGIAPQMEALMPPRTVDASTLLYWLKQPDEARTTLQESDSTDFDELMAMMRHFVSRFNRLVADAGNDYEVWTRGNFDLPILESLLRQLGLPIPWHFRAARDLRTLLEVAGVDISHIEPPLGFIKHNPLWDCKFQKLCYLEAMRVIRSRT